MVASMENWISAVLARHHVRASAPCRVDMGGTLDIATFYFPLQHTGPCTFNAALNMRTSVKLSPYRPGWVNISSEGFESAAFPLEEAPFSHALGLMFAVAAHFNAAGVHIRIESASPPRSALGGSSVAAVALVGALARCRALAGGADLQRDQIVRRAHEIEATVAGVPCGIQDQLAAAYGGINIWHWNVDANGLAVGRESLMTSMAPETFQTHVLVAYGGLPHESRDVNGTWVRQFLAGKQRSAWQRVAECVRRFSKAFANGDWAAAAEAMNAETAIRREMTPEVLDDLGTALVEAAAAKGCGGRFTGAGGGGCLWAVGEAGPIRGLRMVWADLLSGREEARFLDVNPDWQGLTVVTGPHRESGK